MNIKKDMKELQKLINKKYDRKAGIIGTWIPHLPPLFRPLIVTDFTSYRAFVKYMKSL